MHKIYEFTKKLKTQVTEKLSKYDTKVKGEFTFFKDGLVSYYNFLSAR